MICMVLGLSLCAVLGSLFTAYPVVLALLMALIAGVTVFSFGALNIVGPSAIFMVLVFAMSSAMPATDWYGALSRGLLVATGGILSLFFALMSWLIDPNKPEREVIQRLYLQLNQLIAGVGSSGFQQKHADFLLALSEANHILQSNYISLHQTKQFKQLYALNRRANRIWLILADVTVRTTEQVDTLSDLNYRVLYSI